MSKWDLDWLLESPPQIEDWWLYVRPKPWYRRPLGAFLDWLTG